LENGMRQPESVVKNLDVLAHGIRSNLEKILGPEPASRHCEKTILVNKRKLNLPSQLFNVLR
jgi:hypothetical protein